jgi:hypothetical protein
MTLAEENNVYGSVDSVTDPHLASLLRLHAHFDKALAANSARVNSRITDSNRIREAEAIDK